MYMYVYARYLLGEGSVGAGNESANRTATRGSVMVGINAHNHQPLQLQDREDRGEEERTDREEEKEEDVPCTCSYFKENV